MTTSATLARRAGPRTDEIVSFALEAGPQTGSAPISTGIPLPRGLVRDISRLQLTTGDSRGLPAQFEPLAHWPDGSLRAVRLDFIANSDDAPRHYALVETDRAPSVQTFDSCFSLHLDDERVIATLPDLGDVELTFPLMSAANQPLTPRWDNIEWISRGPIRSTARLTGTTEGRRGPRVTLIITAYATTPHLELSFTILNPRRAKHRGGLWDLGDRNTFRFRSFEVVASRPGPHEVHTKLDPSQAARGPLAQADIYQDSSGGDNWNSINHVNAQGVVPCRFRGYQYHDSETSDASGHRATPTFVLQGAHPLALTLPHFWQQFPKGIHASSGEIRAALFPAEWNGDHELQPGEQKTHVLWLSLSDDIDSLDFAHRPPLPILPAEWYAKCQLFDAFPSAPPTDERLQDYLSVAIDPHAGLAARREVIDEYGWRHWGDLWADHEQPDPAGPPVISHYNNQYDVLEGCLRQFARSGKRGWWELALPLARHSVDIDLYHTDEDRSVYNQGYFWHTDHYQSAGTATHRTYSRENAAGRSFYGGGPSSSHCYSTGLLHLYYFTGDPAYRDAVVGLADWLIAMEDGAKTEFCLVDSEPTGLSTLSFESWYHGPGRGPANTLNTLVDAWELTRDVRYRDHAEDLIRRVVVPGEDFGPHELLDVERRWFYIMFLQSLAKYLAAKSAANENDGAYGYALAVARDYAAWMLKHERPFFEKPEQLEFPTETWGAQDIRKANTMRQLARYCDEPLARQVLERAGAIADRGWHDLLRFETKYKLRPTAIMLIEGLRDEFFRIGTEPPAPPAAHLPERRPQREPFLTQRDRVRQNLRSPAGLLRAAGHAINPRRWKNFAQALRARF